MICFAAVAMAIRPDAHWRSIVCAGTLAGSPAAKPALRAMFIPAVPAASTVPITMSSIAARPWSSMRPARCTACAMAWAIIVGDLVLLSDPRNARPMPVRAVLTMTASLMTFSLVFVVCEDACSGGTPNAIRMRRRWIRIGAFASRDPMRLAANRTSDRPVLPCRPAVSTASSSRTRSRTDARNVAAARRSSAARSSRP